MQFTSLRRLFGKSALPILVFVLVLVGLITLVVLTGRDPVVTAIDPSVAEVGDRITVTGRHFGERTGTVRLAGTTLPSSVIVRWADREIVLTLPRGSDSGLLYIVTAGGASDGTLLRMMRSVPRSGAASATPGAPSIAGLTDAEVRIGTILAIRGENFGTQRRSSQVLFAAVVDGRTITPEPAAVSYPLWTDAEIHVRVPSGAQPGFVTVQTDWGASNPMRVAIERPSGEIVRTDRTEIALTYGVSIADLVRVDDAPVAPGSGDLVVWLPRVRSAPSQTNVRYLDRGPVADVTTERDEVEALRFEDVPDGFTTRVVRTVVVDRYGARLEINPSRVSPVYERDSGFFGYYTRSTGTFPASDERISDVAASVRRRRASPYQIARAAYDWVLDTMDYALYSDSRGPLAGLERGYGDDFTYAALFVTVLRAASIPARIVGGVLVSGDGDGYPHFWGEFFVPEIGWVPADPALGDGAFPAAFVPPESPAEFYFGALDSSRVAFMHGLAENGPDLRGGMQVIPVDPYTAQRRYVEAGTAIESLSVMWSVPQVVARRRW